MNDQQKHHDKCPAIDGFGCRCDVLNDKQQICPDCGSYEWDHSTVWVSGMETQAYQCTDCGRIYGGDLS